jgi:hypothetical protein
MMSSVRCKQVKQILNEINRDKDIELDITVHP